MKILCKSLLAILSIGISTSTHAQQSAEQALNSCMQTRMVQGAAIGAAVGGIFGALLGNNNNRGKNTAIGAGVGAVAGGAIAWRTSWASCTKSLNLATASSLKTDDYNNTAQRYNYHGNGAVLKIESVNVPSPIYGGGTMKSDLTYALLIPEAIETDVQVSRFIQCGETQIPVEPERYKVSPSTISSSGNVLIPNISNDIGQQNCTIRLIVEAAGLKDQWQGNFVIVPGGNNQRQATYAQPPVPPAPAQSYYPPPPQE